MRENLPRNTAAPREVDPADPRCPACGRAVYQAAPQTWDAGRGRLVLIGEPDLTWRHVDDGTVAVFDTGALRCAGGGLDNQGRPVHGDKVPYSTARAELLGGVA